MGLEDFQDWVGVKAGSAGARQLGGGFREVDAVDK